MAEAVYVVFACLALFLPALVSAMNVSYDHRALKINGQRKLILSGSIHYPRSTVGMWRPLIQKAKEGGLNTIDTYVFWNAHEPRRREYDFKGNLDLVRFIKIIKEEGLYSILRIGPYIGAEWTFGGLPVWLLDIPGIEIRTNNDVFKFEMKSFTSYIVNLMKSQSLFASQGGPIILGQIENEYGLVMSSYGDDGYAYLQWCANLTESYELEIPWIMCQQNDAPEPLISACNGWYCDDWSPRSGATPKAWAESWVGWFKNWGGADPHRPAEDIAFSVARFFQTGGAIHNYYMYHGGTNFGNYAGGPFIATSYDYDAPLDEYGNKNQPKWGHLKRLHDVIMFMEDTLIYGTRHHMNLQNQTYVTTYSYKGKRLCFLSNADNKNQQIIEFEGNEYTIPPWSVSILSDCYTEVFNTAKVTSQTSIMEKKPDNAYVANLQWVWRAENPQFLGFGSYHQIATEVENSLLDQKTVTNGASDYLWLFTNVTYDNNPPLGDKIRKTTLQVHSEGHLLHAFVNGKHAGSQFSSYGNYPFDFETNVKLLSGSNHFAMLSGTVGYNSHGRHFDTVKHGVTGPIRLISKGFENDHVIHNLSISNWVYKVGLNGVDEGIHQSRVNDGWIPLPAKSSLIWYKTTFKSPRGTNPVVVNLAGLGKGIAWVNGFSIGRYWPSYLSSKDGCEASCDYRGLYQPSKCIKNCASFSQRWYHIPRDILSDFEDNTLVLFEELGLQPIHVSIQTVTVGRICAYGHKGSILELSCQGGSKIEDITFASFGLPAGSCGAFTKNSCDASGAKFVVEKKCLGQESCSLEVNVTTFGEVRCQPSEYKLAVEALCHSRSPSSGNILNVQVWNLRGVCWICILMVMTISIRPMT